MSRPVLFVLAGVNGAGKSSVGGDVLNQGGMPWFNPDTYARELVRRFGRSQEQANAQAWSEGVRRLDEAIQQNENYAFETTLGGQSIVQRLIQASASHDVFIWFCGLRDAEQHIARVRFRVTRGGHDIAEERIRQRCKTSFLNLLLLMPHLAGLRVYDNSVDVNLGQQVPEPVLVLHVQGAQVRYPTSVSEIEATPEWAKPIVEAALAVGELNSGTER